MNTRLKDFLQEYARKEESEPGYGIQWGFGDDECDIEIEFEPRTPYLSGGCMQAYRPILYKGKEIGICHEWIRGGIFDRMHESYECYVEKPTKMDKISPHFYVDMEWEDCEGGWMVFAKLQDMVNYLRLKGNTL